MEIIINVKAVTPVYEQIISQICEAVMDGQLKMGAMLPSIRQLASDLEINHNTVAKAYQLLERNGVIITAGRRGTFINKNALNNISNHAETHLSMKLRNLLEESQSMGLSINQIETILKQTIKSIKSKRE